MNTTASAFWIFAAVVAGFFVYSVFVSYLVARAESYSPQQKLAQILAVWLLPLAGAVVVHWFATHGATELPPIERNPYREHELPE